MEDQFIIYDVKAEDTLALIGSKIGMSGDEVRDFHNQKCSENGLMYFNSLVGIKKIVLPKNHKSPADLEAELKAALPKPIFSEDFYAASYQVLESFDNDLNIAYLVNLRPKKEKNQNSITLTKSNFKKNNISPDDKMSDIALACAQSIEPVVLKVDEFGLPVEIQNHEQLKSDFAKQKSDLQDFYIGEVYAAYLDKFENSISDKQVLLDKLLATLLYQILFPDMRWFDKKTPWTEDFFVLQNSFLLKSEFKATYNIQSTRFSETVINGEILEKYSLSEILKGIKTGEEIDEPAQIEVKISYQTNKITKHLESATANLLFWQDGELYKEHKLTLTQN